jgi:hypothetical protein
MTTVETEIDTEIEMEIDMLTHINVMPRPKPSREPPDHIDETRHILRSLCLQDQRQRKRLYKIRCIVFFPKN